MGSRYYRGRYGGEYKIKVGFSRTPGILAVVPCVRACCVAQIKRECLTFQDPTFHSVGALLCSPGGTNMHGTVSWHRSSYRSPVVRGTVAYDSPIASHLSRHDLATYHPPCIRRYIVVLSLFCNEQNKRGRGHASSSAVVISRALQ